MVFIEQALDGAARGSAFLHNGANPNAPLRCRFPLKGYAIQQLADITSWAAPQLALPNASTIVVAACEQARSVLALGGDGDDSHTMLSAAGLTHDEALAALRLRSISHAAIQDLLATATIALPEDAVRWRLTFACTAALAATVYGNAEAALLQATQVWNAARVSASMTLRLQQAAQQLARTQPESSATSQLLELLASGG